MKSVNKRHLVFALSSILIIFTVIITVIASAISYHDNWNDRDFEEFSSGWLDENDEEVRLDKLTKSCRLHKEIPDLPSDVTLSFNARNMDVDVYVDDILLYSKKEPDSKFLRTIFGKSSGSDFIEVKILKPYRDRTIYLDVNIPYSNGRACKIVHMNMGDGAEIIKHDASIQLGSFCFSIIILFLGVICLILYIPLRHSKMADRSMLYLGVSAFTFGMSMITDCKLLHIIVGHETLYYTMSQMYMILITVPIMLFFSKLYGNLNDRIVLILSAANIIDFIVIFTLDCLGIVDYHDNSVPTLLILGSSLVYMMFVTIKDLIKEGNKNIFHNIGVLMIGISAVTDMIMTRMDYFVETSFFTRFGIAGFTCMECSQVLWKHVKNYQNGLKAQLLSRLAYHDGLTDLLNRTSFMEDMTELEKSGQKNVLIAMFDVNGLKYVNDNFGHSDGDELIINAANAIKTAFRDLGKCYRIGGDEFVVIAVGEDAEKRYPEALDAMNRLLEELNDKCEYPVSVASGYSVTDKEHPSVRDVIDIADDRMYDNKKLMKAEIRLADAS